MSDLKNLILQDARLSAAEFSAHLYPDRSRRRATTLGARVLNRAGQFPAHLSPTAGQYVCQLLADLTAGLARPSGRPVLEIEERALVTLARDPRLHRPALGAAVFSQYSPKTAEIYWADVLKGARRLEPNELQTLRTELQALVGKLKRVGVA